MSAEVLRRAASLMREQAEAATSGPWSAVAGAFGDPSNGPDHMRVVQSPHRNAIDAVARTEYDRQGGADAEHIASWHPVVALAVADWLDAQAERAEIGFAGKVYEQACTVAVAYLGESA